MIFRVENEAGKRERHKTPHRVFVLALKLGDAENRDMWVICRRVWRRWGEGVGYEYNIGDGVWRFPFVTMY